MQRDPKIGFGSFGEHVGSITCLVGDVRCVSAPSSITCLVGDVRCVSAPARGGAMPFDGAEERAEGERTSSDHTETGFDGGPDDDISVKPVSR